MAGINYTLGMKTSGFDAGVKGALGKLAGLGKAAAVATAAAGAAGGVAIAAIIGKSIGKAAEIETLQTAFIPLLGGVKQAKDRLAELAAFAAATPFELPEIAMASKTLETLTRGMLSTGKGLILVGDLARVTNQPFSDLATVVGRLYEGLQSGRPVGEVMMRLQELGAISGDTRAQIESLQASGAAGSEVWTIAEQELGRFSGSMQLQSATWTGLMSTFKDTVSMTMATFGKPIIDALKPYLEGATARIESFQAAAMKAGQAIGDALGLLRAAFDGGKVMELAGNTLKLAFADAVNLLAKGVQAAMAGVAAGFRESGLQGTLQAVFAGVGELLAEKLRNAGADFADAIGRTGAAADLRRGADASGLRAENYFTTARAGMSIMDPSTGIAAFQREFQETFKALPELIDTGGMRKKLNETVKPLQGAAAADSVFREAFAEMAANGLPKGNTPAPGEALAGIAPGGRGATASDRLSQIGGYVGGSSSAMARKAADATAHWTQRTAEGIQKLIARPLASPSSTF